MHNKFTNKVSVIDIAIPNDYNVVEKRAEKIIIYVHLAIEIKALWNNFVWHVIKFDFIDQMRLHCI